MSDAKTDQNDDKDKGNSFVSDDHFDNPHEKALENLVTATDSAGIERIVSVGNETFTPAPLTASDEEIEAANRREAMFDKASKVRQDALEGKVEDTDRAVNNPADGGSQTATTTQGEADAKKADAKKDDATPTKTGS